MYFDNTFLCIYTNTFIPPNLTLTFLDLPTCELRCLQATLVKYSFSSGKCSPSIYFQSYMYLCVRLLWAKCVFYIALSCLQIVHILLGTADFVLLGYFCQKYSFSVPLGTVIQRNRQTDTETKVPMR